MPALVLVVGFAVAAIAAVTAQMRCIDAAASAARLAARGEQTGSVRAAARAVAPHPADVTVSVHGGQVTVEVSSALRLPFVGLRLPVSHIRASFTEALEPGTQP